MSGLESTANYRDFIYWGYRILWDREPDEWVYEYWRTMFQNGFDSGFFWAALTTAPEFISRLEGHPYLQVALPGATSVTSMEAVEPESPQGELAAMEFTGERFVPQLESSITANEHWHRYQFAAQFVTGKSVLDIASGEGYGSAFLSRTAGEVYGCDVSAQAVEHAIKKYNRPNLHFIMGSASNIPLEGSELFDVIVSFETIEHLSQEEQRQFLSETKRLLKRNGILVVSTPNRLYNADIQVPKNPYHLHEFYLQEFSDLLNSFFKNVQILNQTVYPASFMWQDGGREFSPFFMDYQGGEYGPSDLALKSVFYIALCSDDIRAVFPGNTVSIDLHGNTTISS